MYFVYYKDHIIDFTDRRTSVHDAIVALAPGEVISVAKMLENLENSKNLGIISPDPKMAFEDFASQMTLVEAAGGVVENERGELLMIYRNNRWDLPKGHVERGESTADAAVREVEEETGLVDVERGDILATIYHFYPLDGTWIMKRTWWYSMSGSGNPVPQTEEGITLVEWVPATRIPQCAENTFASVREVLKLVRPYDENILNLQNIIP